MTQRKKAKVVKRNTPLNRENAILLLAGVLRPYLFGEYKVKVLKSEACADAIFNKFILIERDARK